MEFMQHNNNYTVSQLEHLSHLMTNSAESIIFPHWLFARMPPFPTTAQEAIVLFEKGLTWNQNLKIKS